VTQVFCISAGQKTTKKTDHVIHRRNRYLNYGLLSLATILNDSGIRSRQIQGNFDSPVSVFDRCLDLGMAESRFPVLVSIPSFYAVSWANEFNELIKSRLPEKRIIVGGRWVVDGQLSEMKQLVPLADDVISGTAESIIYNLVCGNNNYEQRIVLGGAQFHLNYELLEDRALYQPSIEISRGCGMGCSFCQEKSEPLTKLKPANNVVGEVRETLLFDGLNPMNLYFEASMFTPNETWIRSLIESREKHGVDFHWRTEARVDSVHPRHLNALYASGLRVLDLGLESADPTQLKRMNKTSNPEKYLARASELIEQAYAAGIAVKVNILLFAGETEASIVRTRAWLEKHRHAITGVSVGPVIVFGWPKRVAHYLSELASFGANISHSPVAGVVHLNLSPEIDYYRSIELSAEIGKDFTTSSDYFFLKSFSYFSRDYTEHSFMLDCEATEHQLNFSL
jgi:hypothetical protein